MKVTLDLTRLRHDGAISAAEFDRLVGLGRRDTSMLLVNVLVGFGVIAVALGIVALVPSAIAGAVIGAVMMIAGVTLSIVGPARWAILSTICTLIAAFLFGAGLVLLSQGVTTMADIDAPHVLMPLSLALVIVASLFAACSALARSGLLASCAVLALFAALGGRSYYDTATYGLQVTEPFATIVLFSALALLTYVTSRLVSPVWERLAIIVARTALLLVNLGFWIGSLWGDDLDWLGVRTHVGLSADSFMIIWAVLQFGLALWAGLNNRRWALNLAAVFGGINFYTQWFAWMGATPESVLISGLVLLAFALVLWRLNRRFDGGTPSRTAV